MPHVTLERRLCIAEQQFGELMRTYLKDDSPVVLLKIIQTKLEKLAVEYCSEILLSTQQKYIAKYEGTVKGLQNTLKEDLNGKPIRCSAQVEERITEVVSDHRTPLFKALNKKTGMPFSLRRGSITSRSQTIIALEAAMNPESKVEEIRFSPAH